MADLMTLAATLVQAMFTWFVEDLIIETLGAFRDSLVTLFTGNIMGLAGPLIAFLMVMALGMVVMLSRWSS